MVMVLRDYQHDCVEAVLDWWRTRGPNVLVNLPTGAGKALRADQKVLTPNGWVPIGEMAVGDRVYGPDGLPVMVTGVYPQGIRKMFRVTVNDGASVVCDGEHLWTVRTKHDKNDGYPWRTITLNEMVRKGISSNGGYRWEIPIVKPIVFNNPIDDMFGHPPIDPYLLGVILGDGCLAVPGRVILTLEPELADTVASFIPKPCTITKIGDCGKAGSYIIGGNVGRAPNPVLTAIRDMGLEGTNSHNKFIPDRYMSGTPHERLELLRGLMDTDGYPFKGRHGAEITLANHTMALQVVDIVRSLGGVASVRNKETKWTYNGETKRGEAWRVIVSLDECCFRWKHNRWTPRTITVGRRIVSVEPCGEGEAVCIKIDSDDGLFVTEGHIVTHNTVIFSSIGKHVRDLGFNRILVLAHRNELIQQAVDKWKMVDPSESIGIYQGDRRDLHCSVIVASIASCYGDIERDEDCSCTQGPPIIDNDGWPTGKAEKRKADKKCPHCGGRGKVKAFVRKGRIHDLPLEEIDLIIIDEVHHFTKDSQYAAVIKAIREVNPGAFVLGVTATPYRSDGQGLGHAFTAITFARSMKWMIEQGYLAPLRQGQKIDLHVDLSAVRVSKSSGDFDEKALGHVMDVPGAREQIVKAWIESAGPGTCEHKAGRSTAVFCPTVDAAKHLCAEFTAAGVKADWIAATGKDCTTDRRRSVLRRFEQGEITVIVNVGVLTEGWDVQRTSCIVVARPTKSRGLFVQMVGRGLRWMGKQGKREESESLGKSDCLVLDCVGASTLGLISLADLSDETPPEKKAKKKADDEEIQTEFKIPGEIETRRVTGYTTYEVDLFGGGVDWCRIVGNDRVASVKQGCHLIVHPDPTGSMIPCGGTSLALPYRVLLLDQADKHSPLHVMVQGVKEKEALAIAESYALNHGEKQFVQPSDYRKKMPSTERQRSFLANLNTRYEECRIDRMPHPQQMSMPQAAAWIGYLTSLRIYSALARDGRSIPMLQMADKTQDVESTQESARAVGVNLS